MISGLPADLDGVQLSGHKVVPRVSTRTPKTGIWVGLRVLEGTISYAAAGEFPGRSVSLKAMLETDDAPKLNLCTFNPSFESAYGGTASAGATVTSDTAWAADGTKSIRVDPRSPSVGSVNATNLSPNPNLEAGALTGWISGGSSVNATPTIDTTAPISGTRSALSTRLSLTGSSDSSAMVVIVSTVAGRTPVTAGVPISFGVDVKVELAGRRIVSYATWYDAALATISTTTQVEAVNPATPGQVYRVAQTLTPPANATSAYFYVRVYAVTGNATPGERVWLDRLRISTGSDASYFDGSTPADATYGYRWTGTVNASTSERYAWSYNNSTSAYPVGAGDAAGTGLARLGLTKGQTYTLSATVRLTAALTGTQHAYARSILVSTRAVGGATSTLAASTPAPNVAGVYRLKVTFTVPASCEDVFVQLFNGSGYIAESVWWDQLQVELGVTDGAVTGTIANVTEPQDPALTDWLTAPLSPYGSWLKVEHLVYRMDGSLIVVPWGYFRVDALVVDELSATVTIEAGDGSSQVEDRPFVTIGSSRLGSAQMIKAKMTAWLTEVFPAGIAPFWTSPILDFGGFADRAYGGRGGVYADKDRLEALAELGAKLQSGARLIFPRTGSLARLILPGGDDAPGHASVIVGENLIFAEYADRVDRAEMFNEVVVTYETTAGKATVQKRLLTQYTDPGEELSISGPFGYSTRESIAADIPAGTADPDAYVRDLAADAMGRSMSVPRVVNLQSGPIYGLEQGDVVYVQVDPDVAEKRGILTAATIPLTAAGGAWQLEVTMTDTLDAEWIPRYSKPILDEEPIAENFVWRRLKPAITIDLDVGHGSGGAKKLWRGWTVDNSSKTIGGTSLTGTSNGSQVVLWSNLAAWSEIAQEHRYRGRASVTAPNGAIEARVGLDTSLHGRIWGPWTSFTRGKTRTLTVDSKLAISPSAITFGLRIETRGMKSGEQVRLNSASVDRAVRKAT